MRRVVAILYAMLIVGCYNGAEEPVVNPVLPMPTTTIAHLHDIVGRGGAMLGNDVVVEGRVVSSDEDDNFYRTLVVESNGAAIEVMVGLTKLAALYPEGLGVTLTLDDCYADYRYGVLQVGRKGVGQYAVDYLSSREAADRVIARSTAIEVPTPEVTTIHNLQRGMCGRLVTIEALHLVAATSVDEAQGEVLGDAHWAGYTLFKDERGDSIALYTRDYARYATERVPEGSVTITGILQWGKYDGGKECYQLKMRYARDCVCH